MPPSDSLGSAARGMLRVVAILFGLLGVVMFVLPDWSAAHFAWKITPFVAMTMGGWYLGGAVGAWRCAQTWRWSVNYGSLIYLWTFGFLEALVLVAFRDKLVTSEILALGYIVTLVIAAIAAILGTVDWLRMRPGLGDERQHVPLWVRLSVFSIAALTFILAFLGPGRFGSDGSVFPESLSAFTVYAFASFYFGIGLGSFVLVFARRLPPIIDLIRPGYVLIIFVTWAAFVYRDAFDFAAHPGGFIYLAAYIGAFFGAMAIDWYARSRAS